MAPVENTMSSSDKHAWQIEVERLERKLAKIEVMCRRHNSPAVNTGAQSLAGAILRSIEER